MSSGHCNDKAYRYCTIPWFAGTGFVGVPQREDNTPIPFMNRSMGVTWSIGHWEGRPTWVCWASILRGSPAQMRTRVSLVVAEWRSAWFRDNETYTSIHTIVDGGKSAGKPRLAEGCQFLHCHEGEEFDSYTTKGERSTPVLITTIQFLVIFMGRAKLQIDGGWGRSI